MSYIGNTLENQNYVPAIDYFNGDGSTVAFTLSRPVASVAQVQAVISNVPQNPGSAFTVSGSTITFTSAPPSGSSNIYVYYTSPNNQVVTLPQSPTILGTTTFGNSLSYGASGLLASFASNTNGYNQVVLQNASSGASASSDLIVSNNSGTDSTNYGDFGINGSGYSGSGPFSTAGGVYAYAQTGSMSVGTVGAQPLVFGTSNTEQARIDSSGNMGIGTSSPTERLSITRSAAVQDAGFVMRNTTSGYGSSLSIETVRSDDSSVQECARIQVYCVDAYSSAGTSTSDLAFFTQNAGTTAERMRVTANGNFLVGTTSTTPNPGFAIYPSGGFSAGNSAASTGFEFATFRRSGTQIGSITQNGTTAVAYNTSSDYRLKENIQPMQNALSVVAQLNPVTYTWKTDGSDGQGFIAHELQAVVPDCVTGEKDAVDAEGKPVYQGIDTSFLVATLTKAIQEQQEQINQLKAEVAALKGGK